MAKATGEITPKANECLENVRSGKLKGTIHPVITYEFLLQFHRGRIPIFETPEETLGFPRNIFFDGGAVKSRGLDGGGNQI